MAANVKQLVQLASQALSILKKSRQKLDEYKKELTQISGTGEFVGDLEKQIQGGNKTLKEALEDCVSRLAKLRESQKQEDKEKIKPESSSDGDADEASAKEKPVDQKVESKANTMVTVIRLEDKSKIKAKSDEANWMRDVFVDVIQHNLGGFNKKFKNSYEFKESGLHDQFKTFLKKNGETEEEYKERFKKRLLAAIKSYKGDQEDEQNPEEASSEESKSEDRKKEDKKHQDVERKPESSSDGDADKVPAKKKSVDIDKAVEDYLKDNFIATGTYTIINKEFPKADRQKANLDNAIQQIIGKNITGLKEQMEMAKALVAEKRDEFKKYRDDIRNNRVDRIKSELLGAGWEEEAIKPFLKDIYTIEKSKDEKIIKKEVNKKYCSELSLSDSLITQQIGFEEECDKIEQEKNLMVDDVKVTKEINDIIKQINELDTAKGQEAQKMLLSEGANDYFLDKVRDMLADVKAMKGESTEEESKRSISQADLNDDALEVYRFVKGQTWAKGREQDVLNKLDEFGDDISNMRLCLKKKSKPWIQWIKITFMKEVPPENEDGKKTNSGNKDNKKPTYVELDSYNDFVKALQKLDSILESDEDTDEEEQQSVTQADLNKDANSLYTFIRINGWVKKRNQDVLNDLYKFGDDISDMRLHLEKNNMSLVDWMITDLTAINNYNDFVKKLEELYDISHPEKDAEQHESEESDSEETEESDSEETEESDSEETEEDKRKTEKPKVTKKRKKGPVTPRGSIYRYLAKSGMRQDELLDCKEVLKRSKAKINIYFKDKISQIPEIFKGITTSDGLFDKLDQLGLIKKVVKGKRSNVSQVEKSLTKAFLQKYFVSSGWISKSDAPKFQIVVWNYIYKIKRKYNIADTKIERYETKYETKHKGQNVLDERTKKDGNRFAEFDKKFYRKNMNTLRLLKREYKDNDKDMKQFRDLLEYIVSRKKKRRSKKS